MGAAEYKQRLLTARAFDVIGEAVDYVTYSETELCLILEKHCTVTFEHLKKLSVAFSTEKINIRSTHEPDYSDLTPGAGTEVWIELLDYT